MHYKKALFSDLKVKAKENNPESNVRLIEKTYKNSVNLLKKNSSKMSEKELISVAYTLAELKMDAITIRSGIIASLPIELKKIYLEKLSKKSQLKTVLLGLDRILDLEKKQRKNFPAATLSRIILSTALDIRSVILKLAVILNRLRKENEKFEEIKKIKDIYIPIAHKLGLYEIEWEIRDLCFKVEHNKEYYFIKNKVKTKRSERDNKVKKIKETLEEILKNRHLDCAISTRSKSFYSIYRKMKSKNLPINKVHDKYGARIITNNANDCYRILGIIQTVFERTGHFDDYIANPKKNNYQSIHTILKIEGELVEVQIRTWEMNRTAEEGVAAHWRYKDFKGDKYTDSKLSWARQLVEWQRSNTKSNEILESLKLDFGEEYLFAFTPKGDVISVPKGSTALDFAFMIHTDIGLHCKTVKVNGKAKNLDSKINNGDVIEVIIDKKTHPKRTWLTFVRVTKAVSKIKKYLGIDKLKSHKKEIKKLNLSPAKEKRIRFAGCCNPLPGDSVKAFKTTKRKIIIHKEDCIHVKKLKKKDIVELGWKFNSKKQFTATIKVNALDRAGLLTDLLQEFSKEKIKILETKAKSKNMNAVCSFNIEIKSAGQADKLIANLEKVFGVKSVVRI